MSRSRYYPGFRGRRHNAPNPEDENDVRRKLLDDLIEYADGAAAYDPAIALWDARTKTHRRPRRRRRLDDLNMWLSLLPRRRQITAEELAAMTIRPI